MDFGEFSIPHDSHKAVCPECKARVQATDCGFSSCDYRYFGSKIGNTGRLEYVRSEWKKFTRQDDYETFYVSHLGLADWHALVFQTRRTGCTQDDEICCFCFDSLTSSDNGPICQLACKHEFYLRCAKAWITTRGTCPICCAPSPKM